MSTMQAEIYDAFIEAGASESKARAAAEVIAQKPQSDEMATKTDIVRLEGKIDSKIAGLEAKIRHAMWLQGVGIIGIMIMLKIFA